MKFNRRAFLAALAGGAFSGALRCTPQRRAIPGGIVGAAAALGHRLRTGGFPPPKKRLVKSVVVIGGGVAGLACARRLRQHGLQDLCILELAERPGGNAVWGENEVSAYPWGAHYLPAPNAEQPLLLEFLAEIGVVSEIRPDGTPVFNPEDLCLDPDERLYIHGRWQEGLVPKTGLRPAEREQFVAFDAEIAKMRYARGRDGKFAFALPVDESSRDDAFRVLDKISMDGWLKQKGWNAAPLRWYVNYCCRDDYGRPMEEVSAWAGVHYFASRRPPDSAPETEDLTWPQGNGRLIQGFLQTLKPFIRTNALVYRVETNGDEINVDYWDVKAEESIRIVTEKVVFATPRFVTERILPDLTREPDFMYSPWLTANITLDAVPANTHGAPLAWDNVSYHHESLGYVVANHQSLARFQPAYVLTYYLPLDKLPPRPAREAAFRRTYGEWQNIILDELSSLHPGIESQIRQIDVWLWGHGMIIPAPGFIWGEARKRAGKPLSKLYFAHSDLGGISVFEEAFGQGVRAADELLQKSVW